MTAFEDQRRQFYLASGLTACLAGMAARQAPANAPPGDQADAPFFEYDYPSQPGAVTTLHYDPHLRVATIADGQSNET